MANYFAQLPAYRDPGALDFSPLNSAVQNFGQTTRANAMAEYQAGQDRKQNARADAASGRAQATFDAERGKEALNQLAGIYQSIEESPEAERAGLYERLRPMYSKLAQRIPDFQTDLTAMGVDPNDHVAVGKLVLGRARGVRNASTNEFGKAGAVFQGEDGKFYTVQFSESGERRILPLADGMTPARGVSEVDTGTGTRVINKATGADVREIPKNVAGKAAQEEVGTAQGKATADIPRIEANADRALQTIDQIRKHPGKKYGLGITAATGYLPATEARGFTNLVDQAKGQTFLEAFNSLRGGGQITEAEGAKATQALARLDRYQNEADFDAALKDLEDVVRKGLQVAKQKAGGGNATSAPASGGWGYIGTVP